MPSWPPGSASRTGRRGGRRRRTTACQSRCPTFLLLADGRQYLLGERTVSPPGNITLSPDGRRLGRDVTGRQVARLPLPSDQFPIGPVDDGSAVVLCEPFHDHALRR
ncbi:hypothetical protein [Nonomuraea sp. NPDC052265]|uniref:hypothetical protein n=1 Tax=Nonomuraea sp. NPDC052265 TaxID=3364374 RepID=UPI0037C82EE5